MRAFAFGLIVGAGLCFAVIRITAPPLVQSAPSEPLPVLQADQPPSCPEVASVTVASSTPSAPRNTEPNAKERASYSGAVNPQPDPAVPAAIVHRRVAFEEMTEEEANAACARVHNLQQQRERAKKEAEPKDPGWADSMEALIRQHIESHLSPAQYSKLQIQCRTTFCELRMEGAGEEAQILADKASKQIANQSWSDMVFVSGQTTGNINGTWQIGYEWFRPRTAAERRLWSWPPSPR